MAVHPLRVLRAVGGDRYGLGYVLAPVLAHPLRSAVLFLPVARQPLPELLRVFGFAGPGLGRAEEQETGLALPVIEGVGDTAGAEHPAEGVRVLVGPDRVILLAALPAEGERHQHAVPIPGDELLALERDVAVLLFLYGGVDGVAAAHELV